MIVNRHLTVPALACLCGYFVLASTFTWISLPDCFLATASLEFSELQRRRDELRSLLRSITFPPIESFTVDGVTYSLPLKARPPPEQKPTREELEYLCGFFDGDGCVRMCATTGSMYVQVRQGISNVHNLLRFRNVFGGAVYVDHQRTGFSQTTLMWQVSGKPASFAAGLMARVPSMKQNQLEIAASGIVEAARRSKVKAKLKTMKQKSYIPTSLVVTWPYFAGFFDAGGYIRVQPRGYLHIEVRQVNPTVLESLLPFLRDHDLTHWKLQHGGKYASLRCSHLQTCKLTLKHLLQNGLSGKRQQAKIALELTPANHQKIRDALSSLTGRQARPYIRLDEAGCLRAKEINKVQTRLRQSKSAEKRKQSQLELMRLREEHAFANLVSECQTLESDIDMMLSDGGQLRQS